MQRLIGAIDPPSAHTHRVERRSTLSVRAIRRADAAAGNHVSAYTRGALIGSSRQNFRWTNG
jgi:hypothetical protein